MLSAMGTEVTASDHAALLSAHPAGLIVGKIAMNWKSPVLRFRTILKS